MTAAATAAAAGPIDDAFMSKLSAIRGKTVLVTGGNGFLGRHIVELLLECGASVRVFDLAITEHNEEVEYIKGNLLKLKEVESACDGCWAVFHVASPSPLSRNRELFISVNEGGTKNVVKACQNVGVTRVVHTSTASMVFDGTDQYGLDESSAPPAKAMDDYTYSKLLAEKAALAECSPRNPLAVCAIRPHAIFGPRDPHLMPALLRAGNEGKSRYILGNGNNVVDYTYVGNVAYAHLLAAVNLTPDSKLNGQAYFITNAEPVKFWDFVTEVQESFGNTKPWLKLPYTLMYIIALILGLVTKVFPNYRPLFDLQAVNYACKHHWYKCEKARDHFGYVPPVSLSEAQRRNIEYFKHWQSRQHTSSNASHPKRGSAASKRRSGGGGSSALSTIFYLCLCFTIVACLVYFMPIVAKALLPGLIFSEVPMVYTSSNGK